MLGLRLTLGRRRTAVGTCAVCREPIEQHDPHLCVRGLLVHRGCATYRLRREHRLGRPPARPR